MEGEKKSSIAKSILVPSVQELAKKCIVEVPDRYLRLDQHPPILLADNNDQIPIINLDYLLNGSDAELQKLHSACQDWGFFQLINHGVSSSLMEKFKLETHEFFKLPSEEKRKYWQTPNDIEGFGQAFVVSDDQKLDWSDVFLLTTLPKHIRKSHLISMLPLPYRDTLENYSAQLFELAVKLLDCMAKALEIDISAMRNMFGEGRQTLRMNYYPPCPEPNKVIGLTPHSDASALTILLQLNETEGLQIWKDGKWVSIKPLSDCFIINIGDALEILSNGIYRSVLHRAIVNANTERLSVATFYGPSLDLDIEPIRSLITRKTPAKFKRMNMVDYMKGFFARSLDGKSNLERMKINEKISS